MLQQSFRGMTKCVYEQHHNEERQGAWDMTGETRWRGVWDATGRPCGTRRQGPWDDEGELGDIVEQPGAQGIRLGSDVLGKRAC